MNQRYHAVTLLTSAQKLRIFKICIRGTFKFTPRVCPCVNRAAFERTLSRPFPCASARRPCSARPSATSRPRATAFRSTAILQHRRSRRSRVFGVLRPSADPRLPLGGPARGQSLRGCGGMSWRASAGSRGQRRLLILQQDVWETDVGGRKYEAN